MIRKHYSNDCHIVLSTVYLQHDYKRPERGRKFDAWTRRICVCARWKRQCEENVRCVRKNGTASRRMIFDEDRARRFRLELRRYGNAIKSALRVEH